MAIPVPKTLAYPVTAFVSIFGTIASAMDFLVTDEYFMLFFWGPGALVFSVITYNYFKHGHELGAWRFKPKNPNGKRKLLVFIILAYILFCSFLIALFY